MFKKTIYILSALLTAYIISHQAYSYEAFDGRYHYNQNNETSQNTQYGTNEEILIIMDFSASMSKQLGYTARYIQAIDSINTIVQKLPPTTRIGLRVFGIGSNEAANFADRDNNGQINYNELCTASKLVLPVNSNNNYRVSEALSEYRPRGATPIYFSLKQAVENDFNNPFSLKRIILVTDGMENCGGDPCRYIKTIMKQRNDIVIDVIGITIDKNSYSQLSCLSTYGGGRYYNIQKPEDFNVTFQSAFTTVPQYNNNQPQSSYNYSTNTSATNNQFNYGFSSAPENNVNSDLSIINSQHNKKNSSIIKYNNYSFEFDI